jgi:hypothetical protein
VAIVEGDSVADASRQMSRASRKMSRASDAVVEANVTGAVVEANVTGAVVEANVTGAVVEANVEGDLRADAVVEANVEGNSGVDDVLEKETSGIALVARCHLFQSRFLVFCFSFFLAKMIRPIADAVTSSGSITTANQMAR